MFRLSASQKYNLPTIKKVASRKWQSTPKDSLSYLKEKTIHHPEYKKDTSYRHRYPKDYQGPLGTPIQVEKPPQLENYQEHIMSEEVLNQDNGDFDHFGIQEIVKIEEMFDHKMHFGHASSRRHPMMNKFIFGSRYGMDIIDLDQTYPRFIAAMNVFAHSLFRKGTIALVCENPKYWHKLDQVAKKCGFHTIFDNEQQERTAAKVFNNSHIHGEKMPDVWIFFGTQNAIGHMPSPLLTKANLTYGLTIGFVDTDSNPTPLVYRIPANDDSDESIDYYCKILQTVYDKANQEREDYDAKNYQAAIERFNRPRKVSQQSSQADDSKTSAK